MGMRGWNICMSPIAVSATPTAFIATAITGRNLQVWLFFQCKSDDGVVETDQEISRQCHARAHQMAFKDAASADFASVPTQPCSTDTPQEGPGAASADIASVPA